MVGATDWPDFRGPDRTGIVPVEGVFKDKTFGFEVVWKRELGSGYAAISVVGDVGVTMFSDETSDFLTAFDTATGKERWRLVLGPVYKGHSGSQDGPTSTPVIDRDHVYAIDPHGVFVAVNLVDGTKIWEHKLGEDVKARVPHYGFSTVPTVVGDQVLVMTGDAEGRALTSFDAATGQIKWTSGNDTTTYQSPFVWMDGEQRRVLAVTDTQLMALDPTDGSVLWQADHNVLDNESYALPVFVDEQRVIISNRREGAMFEMVRAEDGAMTLNEVWRAPVFARTYAIPMVYGGHAYGFKSQFLTCVNPEDGSVAWRSRPPGGKALTMMDGHLLTISDQGHLVAVECSPNEYIEKARLPLFDQDSYTAVSYANGLLFARNLKEMAAIRVTDKAMESVAIEQPKMEFKGAFGAWLKTVVEADNRQALIEAKLAQYPNTPIIEDGLVHYVYRGDEKDLAVARGFEDEKTMFRVEGTDLFFLSEELDPASHWEYNYSVFGEPLLDPGNPLVVGDGPQARNELRMPNWPVPDHLKEPGGPTGKVQDLSFHSALFDADFEIKVYLPAGYEGSEGRYPLVVNTHQNALTVGKMDRSLDNLLGHKAAPVIVAFLPPLSADQAGVERDKYVDFLCSELVPHLDKSFRTQADPGKRTIMGVGRGAVMSTYAAVKHPEVFGKVANQSFVYFGEMGADLKAALENMAEMKTEFFVELSSNDYDFPGIKAEADSRALVETLKQKGAKVTTVETAGAPSWSHWRSTLGPILESLHPVEVKAEM